MPSRKTTKTTTAAVDEITRQILALGGDPSKVVDTLHEQVFTALLVAARERKGPVRLLDLTPQLEGRVHSSIRSALYNLIAEGRVLRVRWGWYVPKVV